MLIPLVYPWVSLVVWTVFLIFLTILLLRLIFSYADPNPFGTLGRLGYKIRKFTEKWVYPAARFLATFRIDPRFAPILTILIGLLLTFFALGIIWSSFFVIDGLTAGIVLGNPRIFIGFVLYGLLSILVLFIFIRFISYWFVFHKNTFFGFVKRVTDPIMIPAQRLIPPVGMFDVSAMVILIVIWILQVIVVRSFGL